MNGYIDYRGSTIKDFKQDYGRFSIIAKLVENWKLGKTSSVHLIVNHIIISFNVFTTNTVNTLLFLKTQSQYWPELKTILLFLNRLPVVISELDINTLEIPINTELMDILKSL